MQNLCADIAAHDTSEKMSSFDHSGTVSQKKNESHILHTLSSFKGCMYFEEKDRKINLFS